jgi:hypothetical protein
LAIASADLLICDTKAAFTGVVAHHLSGISTVFLHGDWCLVDEELNRDVLDSLLRDPNLCNLRRIITTAAPSVVAPWIKSLKERHSHVCISGITVSCIRCAHCDTDADGGAADDDDLDLW